ncbi:hypothetical protein PTT73_10490 [Serratia ureilytica]|uniref:hypothetical protein n=1 Tax=Serratia ureilytica TaxID=300181 RepID=UPI00313BE49B
MALTTEKLRARAAAYRTDAATLAELGDTASYQRLNESANAFDELAANREAQPVLYASEETLAYAKEGEKSLVTWSEPMGDAVIPLFTIPKAQNSGVVNLPTEFISDEGVMVRLEQVMAALALVGVKYERRGDACRAAMLAQPVSSDYKLVSVEILSTVTRLIDLCMKFIILYDTSDYKEKDINECKNTIEVIDGLLAAVPDGGNG